MDISSNILLFPLVTALLSAIVSLFFWQSPRMQRIVFLLGAAIYLISAVLLFQKVWVDGYVTFQAGKWAAPFGITLIADLFSAGMILLTAILTVVSAFYYEGSGQNQPVSNIFHPLLHFLVFGLTGAFLAGDVFNLYVWFEVMLVSSFVLFTLGGTRSQLEGSIKYVAINVVSSSLFLAGVGVLYGITGSLNMAALAVKIPLVENQGLVTLASTFFLVSFGIKAAIFPLFFWLPASYHTPPVAISALIVGLLTKVGIYTMIRFFTLIFTTDIGFTHTILLILSGFTMVVGVLGAAAQIDFRKILSFHIVSQIGYMVMGLAIFTPLAIAGAVFFIIHNILVKTNLFLISGLVRESHGTFALKRLGGVYHAFPLVALLFAISAFSLTGVPPLSGFWGKYLLALGGFNAGEYIIVAVSLFVSILTLFSMTKIWGEVFWKKLPDDTVTVIATQRKLFTSKWLMVLPIVILTLLIILLGVYSEPFVDYSMRVADQLLDKEEYIRAVFNTVN
ncbi:MAG: proton-conducting transporter membrane subunit [Tenuifilaceae bacterium]|jgi:multicomponent Na+:H+ antiporter subunit D|nr:proton-conducting transporter membrane subunit [Tenuifilaceae bacterium]